jgi:hypothetical protein
MTSIPLLYSKYIHHDLDTHTHLSHARKSEKLEMGTVLLGYHAIRHPWRCQGGRHGQRRSKFTKCTSNKSASLLISSDIVVAPDARIRAHQNCMPRVRIMLCALVMSNIMKQGLQRPTPSTPPCNSTSKRIIQVANPQLFLKNSLVQADESSNSCACYHTSISTQDAFVHRGDRKVLEET